MIVYPPSMEHPKLDAVFFKLSDDEITILNQQAEVFANKIKTTPTQLKNICYSNHLGKHITHQYALDDSTTSQIEKMLLPVVKEYIVRYNNGNFLTMDNLTLLSPKRNSSCWINFQKKYEFHPIHHHFGILSFVIWVKIPYSMSGDKQAIEAEYSPEGDFQFLLRDERSIQPVSLNVDNKWERRGVLFSSDLAHIVYPFYTSDDYRISISGNFKVK